jgi:hypothetical protein
MDSWIRNATVFIPTTTISPLYMGARYQKAIANKTLVVVMGNLRCGEKAWSSLYSNVLDINNADLALMIGKVKSSARTSSLYTRAKYLWEVPEYDDWCDALSLLKNVNSTWREALRRAESGNAYGIAGSPFGGLGDTQGSGAIILMLRWFLLQQLRANGFLDPGKNG